MYPVKQSTALTLIMFVHDVNGDAVTGLLTGGFTKRISKGSGAFAAMTVTITELENGWYSVPLTTTHTNTLGLLSLTFTHASSKQVNLQFRIEAKLTDDLNDAVTAPTAVQNRTEMDSNSVDLNSILADIGTAQSDLDIITGANGVILLPATQSSIDAIEVVTDAQTAITPAAIVDLIWDEELTGGTHNVSVSAGRRLRGLQDFQGYEGGAVWIRTGGTSGTIDYENGTVENPVGGISDAITIASSLNLSRLNIAPSTEITLAQAVDGFEIHAMGATIHLGGQSINDTIIHGGTVDGIATAASGRMTFNQCKMTNGGSFQSADWFQCTKKGTFIITLAGDYNIDDCRARAGAVTYDMGAAVGATTVQIRDWVGSLTFNNLATGDVLNAAGQIGTLTLNGADATVYHMGVYGTHTNNLTGSPSVTKLAAVRGGDIEDILADTSTTIPSQITNLNDITVSDILTTQMTETYAADGTAPTLAQAIFLIQQSIGDFSITGTTITTKKLDGTTAAATYTLDSDTAPTSRTRAT